MGPDSDSERLTRLEATMKVVERDLRFVFPLVKESAELRAGLDHLNEQMRDVKSEQKAAIEEFRHGLECLKKDAKDAEDNRERVRLQREENEREEAKRVEKDRQERALTERRDRWARWVPSAGVAVVIAAEVIKAL